MQLCSGSNPPAASSLAIQAAYTPVYDADSAQRMRLTIRSRNDQKREGFAWLPIRKAASAEAASYDL